MKLKPKAPEEVMADLLQRVVILEENMTDLVEVVTQRDQEVMSIKKEMAEVEETLNERIDELSEILKKQTESMRGLAVGMKNKIATQDSGYKGKDLKYLAHLLKESGYLDEEKTEKQGIISKIFG